MSWVSMQQTQTGKNTHICQWGETVTTECTEARPWRFSEGPFEPDSTDLEQTWRGVK